MAAPRDKGNYIILNAGTRDAIDSWQKRDNENIAAWTPDFLKPNAHQIWRFENVGGDFYRIVNASTGVAWELVDDASAVGKSILTKDIAENSLQHWRFIKRSGPHGVPESYQYVEWFESRQRFAYGDYRIVNKLIDFCADLKNGGGAGTQVLGWSRGDGNPHQTWVFLPVEM